VQFAQEARPYALLLALGMGTMDALARIATRGDNPRRLIALGLCLLGMALTHYFSLGALLASSVRFCALCYTCGITLTPFRVRA